MAWRTPENEKARFELELEFLESLSNPQYLSYLAQSNYFEEESFLKYLSYLQYWKAPEYAKFVVYPHAFAFLDLLQQEQFRASLRDPDFVSEIENQQNLHFDYFRNNRISKNTLVSSEKKVETDEEPSA
jgi:mediator of RNA polymerase II transcription subunit 31